MEYYVAKYMYYATKAADDNHSHKNAFVALSRKCEGANGTVYYITLSTYYNSSDEAFKDLSAMQIAEKYGLKSGNILVVEDSCCYIIELTSDGFQEDAQTSGEDNPSKQIAPGMITLDFLSKFSVADYVDHSSEAK